MMEEFPHLRTLNGKELSRMTPAQLELRRLRETSDVNIEEEKEVASARPGSSRGAPPTKPRPQTSFVKSKPAPTIEEMHRKNFIEDLNTSVLQLKQTFKAAMSRIKTTLQSIFELPGERGSASSTGSLFPTQVKSGSLRVIDEMDEDKSALEQSMQDEEEKWFADELRRSQEPTGAGAASLQRKLEAFERESSGQSSTTDLSRSSHKIMKHKYIKLEKTTKPESAPDLDDPVLLLRPNSKHRQKLQRAKDWTASQEEMQG